MKSRDVLAAIPLIIALVLLLIPLYFIHSEIVDRLTELSVYLAKGIFQTLGLPK